VAIPKVQHGEDLIERLCHPARNDRGLAPNSSLETIHCAQDGGRANCPLSINS
jgi:hypothetical protein